MRQGDTGLAKEVEPLEQVVDALNKEEKQRHINRLRTGTCTIELGFVLSDISTNFERAADHCSNIAVCLLQVDEGGFDTHEYLDILKEENSEEFRHEYMELSRNTLCRRVNMEENNYGKYLYSGGRHKYSGD